MGCVAASAVLLVVALMLSGWMGKVGRRQETITSSQQSMAVAAICQYWCRFRHTVEFQDEQGPPHGMCSFVLILSMPACDRKQQ